CQQYGNFPF
nr:immunoglobulin light chain junction region [Macaca mulatta]MPN90148.1 immunoglobulin light chain junction region [Macaca mulatta]